MFKSYQAVTLSVPFFFRFCINSFYKGEMTLVEMLKIDERIEFDFNSIINYMFRNLEVIGDEIVSKSDNKNKVNLTGFIESLKSLTEIHDELMKFNDTKFMNTSGIYDCKFIPSNGISVYGDIIEFYIELSHLNALIKRDNKYSPQFYIEWIKITD